MDICSGIDICGDVSTCVCAFVAAGVGTFISCIDLTGVNCAAACCGGIIEGTSETLGSLFNMPAVAPASRACDVSMVADVAPAALSVDAEDEEEGYTPIDKDDHVKSGRLRRALSLRVTRGRAQY